jgi:hypothetical protein
MNDIILAAYHGGLGDNLQFSTLPEEFYKQQGKETYIWSGATYRSQETFDLVWGTNPYIKGIKDGDWNAGDYPGCFYGNYTNSQDGIANWEFCHGLNPINHYPKIYYAADKLNGYENVYLVDLSSISLNHPREKLIQVYEEIKRNNPNITFVEIVHNFKYSTLQKHENLETEKIYIKNLFDYYNLLNSCKGFVNLLSGSNLMAVAAKNNNKNLDINCIVDKEVYDSLSANWVFDNVNYLVY